MVRLTWIGAALDRLDETAEYVAVSNHHAAKKLVQTVFEKVSRLEMFSESGHVPAELQAMAYR
jgi:toxin ParE1/3/4